MERTESGRGGEDHDITAITHLLMGVGRQTAVIDIDFALATFADISRRTVQPIANASPWTRLVAVGRERLRGNSVPRTQPMKPIFSLRLSGLQKLRWKRKIAGKHLDAAGFDELASVGSVVFHVVAEIVGMPLPFGNRRMWRWDKEYCGKILPVRWEVSVMRALSLA